MSYEQFFRDGTVFVVESADSSLITYGHDELGWCASWGNGTTSAKAASVFRAMNDGEVLKEAGFYTTDNGTEMTVSVRKYGKTHPGSDIESVEILSQKTETYDFAGWHVMSLDKAVTLESGDFFSIVIEPDNTSYIYPIAIEGKYNGYSDYMVAFDGESYLFSDGRWNDAASLTETREGNVLKIPSNVCVKAFTVFNGVKADEKVDDEDRSIDGVKVASTPVVTVPAEYVEAHNPVENEDSFKGRVISQIAVDNNGDPLPEGVSLDIYLIYINEFFEDTPPLSSTYGVIEQLGEIDPFYPVGYAPDGYMEIDGILLPVYLTQVVTGKGGMVTIDADNMKRTIPAGYYDVMYSSKTPPVVGMLRVIEITESEESSDDSSSGDISSRDISNGVPS